MPFSLCMTCACTLLVLLDMWIWLRVLLAALKLDWVNICYNISCKFWPGMKNVPHNFGADFCVRHLYVGAVCVHDIMTALVHWQSRNPPQTL
jgi:hypothetical protein